MADTHLDAHVRSSIKNHTEACLMYVRRKTYIMYANAEKLAIDYGLYGTPAFFPLSQLVHDINGDERFRVAAHKEFKICWKIHK